MLKNVIMACLLQEEIMDIEKKDRFINVVGQLCCPGSFGPVVNLHSRSAAMPSRDDLETIMELLRAIIFPGF